MLKRIGYGLEMQRSMGWCYTRGGYTPFPFAKTFLEKFLKTKGLWVEERNS